MKSFTIGPAERQSYYAIRLFAMAHLIGVAGLVLLLDGSEHGLSTGGLTLIALLVLIAIRPMYQVLAARRGGLDGHIVATANSLAILYPNQERRIYHRREFRGFIARRNALITRERALLHLELPGSRAMELDAFDGVVALWWPEHTIRPWRQRLREIADPMLEERVACADFSLKYDLRRFVFVSRPLRLTGYGFAALMIVAFLVVGVTCPFLINATDGTLMRGLAFINIALALSVMCYVAENIRRTWFKMGAIVLGRRSLCVVWRDGTRSIFHASDMLRYNTALGLLIFRERPPLLVAPFLLAGPYRGLVTEMLRWWRPGIGARELDAVRWRHRPDTDSLLATSLVVLLVVDAQFLIPALLLLRIAYGVLVRETPEQCIELTAGDIETRARTGVAHSPMA